MRELIAFDCAGETLAGTVDRAPGRTGLLIVSGGNEIRTGAHRGMAALAQRVAAAGHPVFRYDRRGIGDSTGANGGFENSGPDIAAAADAFRDAAGVERIVAFGNCDSATALALFHGSAGIYALVLANPWTIEATADAPADLPPPAAIRARYAAKLKDPRELWRLVSGGVNLGKVLRGLRRSRQTAPRGLADRLGAALAGADAPISVLIARGDNTAVAFRAALPSIAVLERDTDSHSFAAPGDADWLCERIVEKLG